MTRFRTAEEWLRREALSQLAPTTVPTIHINELEETASDKEQATAELIRLLLKVGAETENDALTEAFGIIPLDRDDFQTVPPTLDQLTREMSAAPPLLAVRHLQNYGLPTIGEVYRRGMDSIALPGALYAEYIVFRDSQDIRDDCEYSVNIELKYVSSSFRELVERKR